MRQATSWIYYCIPGLPQHVSASGCHLQGVVGVSKGTLLDTFHNWPHWTDRNPYTPTIQILLE
jgi:hypothetical protein